MEFKHLTTFLAVAKELSFSKAAEALNYAQSSVTSHVQALEDEFGVPFFERLGKRVILTEAGQRMVAAAEKIMAMVEEAKKMVPGNELPSGTITIGAHESQCTYRLPPILQEFRTRYPQVQLVFRPIISDRNLPTLLAKGIIDVAFMLELPTRPENLTVEPLIEEHILILAHPSHRLAGLEKVTPGDLEGETILTTEQGCTYRQIFEHSLSAYGVHSSTKIEFASIESIKQCVIAGLGIAVLPEMTVTKEIAAGQIKMLSWTEPDFNIYTQIAWHKDKWISPALKAFVDISRKSLHI